MKNSHAPVILRLKQVQARIGLGRSSIYAMMDPRSPYYDSNFPKSIRITAKCVGWIEAEITAWVVARINAGRPHLLICNQKVFKIN